MTQEQPIAAVVLAAGKGTRMKSDLHKVLHPLAGRPMLAHLLESLEALGATRSVLVVGSGREQIHAAFPGLQTVVQEPQLGTGHAVRMAEPALSGFAGVVLVLYGDVPLVTATTMRRLAEAVQGGDALAVLGFRPEDTRSYGRLLTDAEGRLERIVEHADASPEELEIDLCNSGIMAARSEFLFPLLAQLGNDNAKGEYYLTDIVALARAASHGIAVVETQPDEVAGVNSPEELAELESRFEVAR
ncbi:NTP transferase domain-containing protein [Phaeobacter sp. 22II1-1F12B]|uniref:sugar phosphate nucleotidyltransferase n=1 Tax=Phaeobacter sp. 22II1-1F12B TaxID=1317111 RepID=UPI000B51EC15|nr:NTP transferase domain-containing protein [Phaeobacter sp. 22II1-1F12B]